MPFQNQKKDQIKFYAEKILTRISSQIGVMHHHHIVMKHHHQQHMIGVLYHQKLFKAQKHSDNNA